MALFFSFEEEYKTSRKINISNQSFDQEFVFYLCGNFYEEAQVDSIYGPDDDITALQAAYLLLPPFRMMPLYGGGLITLTLNSLGLEQISPDIWKLTVSYSPPEMGGAGAGGYNQNVQQVGPNVGDYQPWSDYFVQLSFNVSSVQEPKTLSRRLVDKKKAAGSANTNLPFTVGYPAPVGYTVEGVEGTQVYARQFSFSVTSYFTPNRLTFPYVRRLFRMATTINDDTFFGFPAGSVLFLEANASGDVFSVVPVTFEFQMRPNFKFSNASPTVLANPLQDDPTLMYDVYHDPWFADSPSGSTPFPGNAFSGWDVVDYGYALQEDGTAKALYQKPVTRWVHSMYERSDFDLLEL